jgi:DNA-binding Lrp family transcriptional regulator
MKAYVLINTRAGDIPAVVRQLRRVQGVLETNMTFGPYDVVAILEARDLNHLGDMIANQVQPIPGVVETMTCVAVEI